MHDTSDLREALAGVFLAAGAFGFAVLLGIFFGMPALLWASSGQDAAASWLHDVTASTVMMGLSALIGLGTVAAFAAGLTLLVLRRR